jgi:hypothetical protein
VGSDGCASVRIFMEGLNMDWIGADWKGWGMELMDMVI